MAIQVNGTQVIGNSRELTNIASVDATTVATLNAGGVGGGGIAYGSTYVPYILNADAGQSPGHIAYDASEDKFVTVDWGTSQGASWKSADGTGKSWVENAHDTDIQYARGGLAASGNGTFVAACNNGKIARSTNLGGSWASVAPSYSGAGGAGGDWCSINYGNGVFIGGYRDQYIFRSTNDGVSWSQPTNPAGAGYLLDDAANDGGNNWLGVALNRIIKSTDNGATWTDLGAKNAPGGTPNWYQIAYGNGKWVKAGQSGWVGSSTNLGSTWTYKQVTNQNFAADSGTYGSGGFIFANGGTPGGFGQSVSGSAGDFLLTAPDAKFASTNLYHAAQNTTTNAAIFTARGARILVRYET